MLRRPLEKKIIHEFLDSENKIICLASPISPISFLSYNVDRAWQEHENRFTFMMGMYLAFTVLFTADSPLGVIGAWFPGLSYFVVFAAGYGCYFLSRLSIMGESDHIPAFLLTPRTRTIILDYPRAITSYSP